jgi:hypothetical protein
MQETAMIWILVDTGCGNGLKDVPTIIRAGKPLHSSASKETTLANHGRNRTIWIETAD